METIYSEEIDLSINVTVNHPSQYFFLNSKRNYIAMFRDKQTSRPSTFHIQLMSDYSCAGSQICE